MIRPIDLLRLPIVNAVMAIGALTAGLVTLPLALAAQEATPDPAGAIPPIIWELTAFEDGAGNSMPVDDPSKYTIQFLPGGQAAIVADCNVGSGDFDLSGNSLEFAPFATTMAMCEPESLSSQYLDQLGFVRSYSIDQSEASDQLLLELADGGGALRFSPALTGVVWEWEQFQGGDGAVIAPDDPALYSLEFHADGTLTGLVDCNRATGSYEVDGPSITITLGTTRMACGDGSLDADFGRLVSESTSFVIRDGLFALALPADGGITTFTPRVVVLNADGTPVASE